MKKVNCICLHDNFKRIVNITVINSHGENVTLLAYNVENTDIKPYEYKHFNDLYKSVLNILKNNNFYVSKCIMFSRIFYSIQFINIKNPYTVENYGYYDENTEESK